jgi:hypothetical protein
MKKIILILAVLIVFSFIFGCVEQPKACTMEAKLCPDGTAVGRTLPNCEFAPCPAVDSNFNNTNSSFDINNFENDLN